MPGIARRSLRGWPAIALAGLATAAGLATVPAQAGPAAVDGCRALAQAVVAGVGAALRRQFTEPGRLPPPAMHAIDELPTRCGRTSAAASAAFAQAFRSHGMAVGWAGQSADEACGLRRLDRCRPTLLPGTLAFGSDPLPLVADTWAAVTTGIGRRMPFGVASDWSYFRPALLGETLAIGIDATLNAPRRVAAPDGQAWDER